MSLSIAIRSAGERTGELCEKLLAEGFADSPRRLVEESPFSLALRRSLALGLDLKRDYHLCVDADVLVSVPGVLKLIDALAKQPEHVCEVQGLIHDGIFQVWRPAGHHLYRSSCLPELLRVLKEEPTEVRPEFHMLCRAGDRGLRWLQTSVRVGLHDHAQWRRDTFRKLCFHRLKHAEAFQLAQAGEGWKDFRGQLAAAPTLDFADYLNSTRFDFISKDIRETREALGEAEEAKLRARLNALSGLPVAPRIQKVLFPESKWDRLR